MLRRLSASINKNASSITPNKVILIAFLTCSPVMNGGRIEALQCGDGRLLQGASSWKA
jgi:hypothetical protein